MSNINGGYHGGAGGGHGNRAFLSGVDFYRRVPKDLTESTTLGVAMSFAAIAVMAILFLSETIAFARSTISTTITLDDVNKDPQIRINFNVTFLDLHCDYVAVDVLDALGTNRQNITKNVEKWQLDAEGTRRIFSGRNREVREVVQEVHEETLEELHEDGVHATLLNADQFDNFLKEYDLVFVDFFAPWCVWCQRLHPTWEKFAEKVDEERLPLQIASVNCVEEATLCTQKQVMAFPTLRWFQNGEPLLPDYKQDRTVNALYNFAQRKVEAIQKYKDWQADAIKRGDQHAATRRAAMMQSRPEHPGCQLSGHLLVNRVPGNFHIEARSKNHNLNAAMTNLTHIVNHLSFGEPMTSWGRRSKRILKLVPDEYKRYNPIDGTVYLTKDYHQAYHHYIKVVSTHVDMSGKSFDASKGASQAQTVDDKSMVTYQFLEQSQVMMYDDFAVPEARFSYDLSPMSVVVTKEGRKWYDYVTSLCAIIGGTFTTLGLIDASLYKVFKSKKID